MNWGQVVQKVTPYIFKIETPTGHGTGFLCLHNEDKTIYGVATSLHVVEYANSWRQPIRLTHSGSFEQLFLKDTEYVIFSDAKTDSAVILFQKPAFELPAESLELIGLFEPLGMGHEVCWLGYPVIEPYTLCFFSGNISAWQDFRKAYLIDGVAINGVSGGPVLCFHDTEGIRIIGVISAYRPNRAEGDPLPGLLSAQDVSHFHGVIYKIRSFDDAKKQKREFEQPGQA